MSISLSCLTGARFERFCQIALKFVYDKFCKFCKRMPSSVCWFWLIECFGDQNGALNTKVNNDSSKLSSSIMPSREIVFAV